MLLSIYIYNMYYITYILYLAHPFIIPRYSLGNIILYVYYIKWYFFYFPFNIIYFDSTLKLSNTIICLAVINDVIIQMVISHNIQPIIFYIIIIHYNIKVCFNNLHFIILNFTIVYVCDIFQIIRMPIGTNIPHFQQAIAIT